jgi:hypothetical protein
MQLTQHEALPYHDRNLVLFDVSGITPILSRHVFKVNRIRQLLRSKRNQFMVLWRKHIVVGHVLGYLSAAPIP